MHCLRILENLERFIVEKRAQPQSSIDTLENNHRKCRANVLQQEKNQNKPEHTTTINTSLVQSLRVDHLHANHTFDVRAPFFGQLIESVLIQVFTIDGDRLNTL